MGECQGCTLLTAFSKPGVRKTLLIFLNAPTRATRGRSSQRLGAGLPGLCSVKEEKALEEDHQLTHPP